VSHVSLVASCSGMTSLETKNALETRRPHKMPHVSRFCCVLARAMVRNLDRSFGLIKRVRSGRPSSVVAEVMKVYFRGSSTAVSGASTGDGVRILEGIAGGESEK
jgi:hypothetical protein